MMLKDFIKSIKGEEARLAFARRCGTSFAYLKLVSYGAKPCGAKLAVQIERESGGLVTRQELRSDWSEIWPELEAA